MVHPPRQVLDALVEAAAQRHVQLLHAAADRQQRHAMLDGGTDQRQRGGVAAKIFRCIADADAWLYTSKEFQNELIAKGDATIALLSLGQRWIERRIVVRRA